jgi:hypothetical protein
MGLAAVLGRRTLVLATGRVTRWAGAARLMISLRGWMGMGRRRRRSCSSELSPSAKMKKVVWAFLGWERVNWRITCFLPFLFRLSIIWSFLLFFAPSPFQPGSAF